MSMSITEFTGTIVTISDDFIARGERRNCYQCPFALALRYTFQKLFPNAAIHVIVGDFIQVHRGEDLIYHRNIVEIPGLSDWIKQYDHREPVEPQSFTL